MEGIERAKTDREMTLADVREALELFNHRLQKSCIAAGVVSITVGGPHPEKPGRDDDTPPPPGLTAQMHKAMRVAYGHLETLETIIAHMNRSVGINPPPESAECTPRLRRA